MEEGNYENQGLHLFCRKPYLEWSGSVLDDNTVFFKSTTKEGKEQTIKIHRTEYNDWDNQTVYPCRIRQRYTDEEGNMLYIAEVFERSEIELKKEVKITQDFVWTVLFDVPRDAFYFKDKKSHRHHHQLWSFRHDMRLPDDIFPDVWKNKMTSLVTKGGREESL